MNSLDKYRADRARCLANFERGVHLSASDARMAACELLDREEDEMRNNEPTFTVRSLVYEPGYNYAVFHGGVSSFLMDNLSEWLATLPEGETKYLRMNSPGGSANAGVAIANLFKADGDVTVVVDGMAYSAASLMLQGARERVMLTGATQGIHYAWTFAAGNAQELRDEADQLDAMDEGLVDLYVQRSELPVDEVRAMMRKDTLMSASDAVRRGFADRKTDTSPLAKMRLPGTATEANVLTTTNDEPVVVASRDDPDAFCLSR